MLLNYFNCECNITERNGTLAIIRIDWLDKIKWVCHQVKFLCFKASTWHHDEAFHVVLEPGPLAAGQGVAATDRAAHLALAAPGNLGSDISLR